MIGQIILRRAGGPALGHRALACLGSTDEAEFKRSFACSRSVQVVAPCLGLITFD